MKQTIDLDNTFELFSFSEDTLKILASDIERQNGIIPCKFKLYDMIFMISKQIHVILPYVHFDFCNGKRIPKS